MDIEKVKQEYLRSIERERERLKDNPFKDKIFIILKEMENRIKEFKGGEVVLLNEHGKFYFKGGNCEVLGKELFKKPTKDFDFKGNTQYFKIVTLHSRGDN